MAYRNLTSTQPQWERERKRPLEWAPSRSLLAALRCYQRFRNRRGPLAALLWRTAVLRHRFWSVVTGASIPLRTRVGGGLLIPHPNGIVINADAVIGANCEIFQQVTIGITAAGVPTVGANVFIGAGAKILGPVTIGDGARIGANALVIRDVPAHGVAYAPMAEIRAPHLKTEAKQ